MNQPFIFRAVTCCNSFSVSGLVTLAPSCGVWRLPPFMNLFNLPLSASVLQHVLHAWKVGRCWVLGWWSYDLPDVSTIFYEWIIRMLLKGFCLNHFSGSGFFSSSKCFSFLGYMMYPNAFQTLPLIFVAIIYFFGNTLISPHIQYLIWFLHLYVGMSWGCDSLLVDLRDTLTKWSLQNF